MRARDLAILFLGRGLFLLSNIDDFLEKVVAEVLLTKLAKLLTGEGT